MKIITKIKEALFSFQIPIHDSFVFDGDYDHCLAIDLGAGRKQKNVTIGLNRYLVSIDLFHVQRKKMTALSSFKRLSIHILNKLEQAIDANFIAGFEFAEIIINGSEYYSCLISLEIPAMSNELEG